MDARDLSQMDRNTLRLWRATNLVGWGLAGLGAYLVTYELTQALIRALSGAPFSPLRLLVLPMWIVALLLPPLVAGIVIGDHVYRWPGWTAIAAGLLPALLLGYRPALLLGYRAGVLMAAAEWLIFALYPLVFSLITARVARARFSMRPRALRAT